MTLLELLIAGAIIALFLCPTAKDTSDADFVNDLSRSSDDEPRDFVSESINGTRRPINAYDIDSTTTESTATNTPEGYNPPKPAAK